MLLNCLYKLFATKKNQKFYLIFIITVSSKKAILVTLCYKIPLNLKSFKRKRMSVSFRDANGKFKA